MYTRAIAEEETEEKMTYDFTTVPDRKGMDAIAIDALGLGDPSFVPLAPEDGFDAIPMWVADMNFVSLRRIQDEIIRRAEHPSFGYFEPRDEYYRAIIDWQTRRNGAEGLLKQHIGYENGVVGGVISAVRALCRPGDAVLVHAPTYIGFIRSLTGAGYRIVYSPLRADANGVPRMDFADMEEKIRANGIRTAVFCSPHNPSGRVWDREEILAFTELCRKYDVHVISDEIWSDILLFGNRHIPTQSVSEDARQRTVSLYAPSKTFNLAGLVGSYHVIYNEDLRTAVRREGTNTHYNSMNVLSMYALIGAYSEEGHLWTDELCEVLSGNIDYACGFIAQHFPDVHVFRPEGTYMLFADCTAYCERTGETLDELLRACWRVGVAVQDGRPFRGSCHMRINLALPLSRVEEAFERLRKYVFTK